ncbi:hypothetical protein [Fodinicurvata sp. EGI_FJ10296]|uniref:hypothetical protein n=1 Tax=Fodinicurvata sp. EGI_FJ10296 TaxID=3231908 RepID=UPI0034533200
MSRELRHGISSLEPITTAALAVLATASGIYTYIGVRGLIEGDTLLSIFACFAYAGAVAVGIFVFWEYIMRFLPRMRGSAARMGLFVAMAIGSVAIIAMSSWLNAAALAGSAAVSQHLAVTTESYQSRLEESHENAIAAQSLLPDIRIAERRFRDLAEREQAEGTLTGTAGRGTVVQYLDQTATSLASLGDQISSAAGETDSLYRQGGRHLNRMRELVSGRGDIQSRTIAYADEAVGLTGVISALTQTSVAPAVQRQARDLARSFIRPAVGDGEGGLRDRQALVLEEVQRTISETSAALSTAAGDILDRPAVAPFRFTPLSPAEAVIRYAGAFVPSWAGAIAIDLLPGVLVLVLMVVHGAIRNQEDQMPPDDSITLRDMRLAIAALDALERRPSANRAVDADQAGQDDAIAATDASAGTDAPSTPDIRDTGTGADRRAAE